jgi:DNA invertase Pin-like site-specific DNA recombinase
MTNYAYIRVSTDAQDCANQRHGVELYAAKNGFGELVFYEDTASGKKDWRQRGLSKLLQCANVDDVLIISEISRLARSTLQVLEILQEAARLGVAVHIVKNNMIMDSSINSRITAVIFGLAAEIEREFISARTTEALQRRKAEGLPIGRPIGAKNKEHKLDKHADQIELMLSRGVHKTSIARIVECHPQTLYSWMYQRGLMRYIKSDKPLKNKKRA